MEMPYFPGCSLHATARAYAASTRAGCAQLGIELTELDGWSRCGSTSAHSVGAGAARVLLRNLRIFEESGGDVMFSCAACYGRTKAAQADDAASNAIDVCHTLDVLDTQENAGLRRSKVTRAVRDLKPSDATIAPPPGPRSHRRNRLREPRGHGPSARGGRHHGADDDEMTVRSRNLRPSQLRRQPGGAEKALQAALGGVDVAQAKRLTMENTCPRRS